MFHMTLVLRRGVQRWTQGIIVPALPRVGDFVYTRFAEDGIPRSCRVTRVVFEAIRAPEVNGNVEPPFSVWVDIEEVPT